MTKEALIFGKMRKIDLADDEKNDDVVRQIREELKEYFTEEASFDMLPDGKNIVLLLFLYDYEGLDSDNLPADANVTRFLTGEGAVELAYPLVDTGRNNMFNEKYFKAIYLKNNKAYGGDDLKIINMTFTSTRMLVALEFVV